MAKMCFIRKDLLNNKMSIPIEGGKSHFISTRKKLPYKYNGNNFFVLYNNAWCKAESIDFDFD